MKKFVLFVLALSLALSSAAFAAEMGPVMKDIKENGVLKTAVFGNSPTYTFHKMVNGVDTLVGFEPALIKEIARRLGEHFGREVTVEFMEGNITSNLAALQAGRVFMCPTLAPTEERKKSYDFSDVYMKSPLVFLSKKEVADDPKFDPKGENALKGLKMAIQMGNFAIPIVQRIYPNVEIVQYDDAASGMLAVMTGKVDLALSNEIAGTNYVLANPQLAIVEKLNYFPTDEEDKGATFGMLYGNDDFREFINAVIKDVHASGEYAGYEKQAIADLDDVILQRYKVEEK